MTAVFAVLLTVHGLIHLLGVAKAFGLADLPQLTQPISPALGLVWLAAAAGFLAAAGLLFLWPRGWWTVAAGAIVLSLSAIIPSWVDAKFGVAANALMLAGVVIGWLAKKP